MSTRRRFLLAFGTTALATPFGAFAQQQAKKLPRFVILLFNSPQAEPIGPLLQGLQALGYEDGKTITIDYRSRRVNRSACPISPRSWCGSNRM